MKWGVGVLIVCSALIPAAAAGPVTASAPAAGPPLLGSFPAADPARTTVYLPNVTKALGGWEGWQTPFIVQNVGTVPTDLDLSFYAFGSGALIARKAVQGLRPGTSFAESPNDDADLPYDTQFAVVVRSTGAPIVAVVNQHNGTGARAEAMSYVGLSDGDTRLYLPFVAKAAAGWTTPFIVQNLGSAAARVTLAFRSHDGSLTASLDRSIAPGRSAVVDPNAEATLRTGLDYSVTVTADQPVGAVVNAHNDAPSVAAPRAFSYNGLTPASGNAYLPYVARSASSGQVTRLFVQNAGATSVTPSVWLQSHDSGAQRQVVSPAAVPPGATWAVDLSSMGEGAHSVVAVGGDLALVAGVLSATSAVGFAGTSTPGTRAYLPNVTRTLGGAAGWTTPIHVQSAGATTLTSRWYRFSDGVLVATRTVSGLSHGVATVLDPRSMSDVPADGQYSVVLEGDGPLTAVVVQAADGADNAMAYDGFLMSLGSVATPRTLTVSPASATVFTGGTRQLSAVASAADGAAVKAPWVTWAVEPASLGTVTAAGTFTAGSMPGSGTVRVSTGAATASVAITTVAPVTASAGSLIIPKSEFSSYTVDASRDYGTSRYWKRQFAGGSSSAEYWYIDFQIDVLAPSKDMAAEVAAARSCAITFSGRDTTREPAASLLPSGTKGCIHEFTSGAAPWGEFVIASRNVLVRASAEPTRRVSDYELMQLVIGLANRQIAVIDRVAPPNVPVPVATPTPTPTPRPTATPVPRTGTFAFTPRTPPDATEGASYTDLRFTFCEPTPSDFALGACGPFPETTNPTGGQAPYHFQLGSGTGFPPIGMSLGKDGQLTGTPARGSGGRTYTFSVCAVDLSGDQVCKTVTLYVRPASTPTPTPTPPGDDCTRFGIAGSRWSGTFSGNYSGTWDATFDAGRLSGINCVFYATSGALVSGGVSYGLWGDAGTNYISCPVDEATCDIFHVDYWWRGTGNNERIGVTWDPWSGPGSLTATTVSGSLIHAGSGTFTGTKR